MKLIEDLIARCDAIADHNNDHFAYHIKIVPLGRGHGCRYEFVCEETADGHPILAGVGDSIEGAIKDLAGDLRASIEGWGYRLPPEALKLYPLSS